MFGNTSVDNVTTRRERSHWWPSLMRRRYWKTRQYYQSFVITIAANKRRPNRRRVSPHTDPRVRHRPRRPLTSPRIPSQDNEYTAVPHERHLRVHAVGVGGAD